MAKLNRSRLQQMREAAKQEFRRSRAGDQETVIIVGMGTCGIAAGARETLDAIRDEAAKAGLSPVLKSTGCMGLCYSEPTVEVLAPGMPAVVYGRVRADVGRQIVRRHLVDRQLVSDHVYDRPAADVLNF